MKPLQSSLCPSQASSDASGDSDLPDREMGEEAAGYQPPPHAAETRRSLQGCGELGEMDLGLLKFDRETTATLLAPGPLGLGAHASHGQSLHCCPPEGWGTKPVKLMAKRKIFPHKHHSDTSPSPPLPSGNTASALKQATAETRSSVQYGSKKYQKELKQTAAQKRNPQETQTGHSRPPRFVSRHSHLSQLGGKHCSSCW